MPTGKQSMFWRIVSQTPIKPVTIPMISVNEVVCPNTENSIMLMDIIQAMNNYPKAKVPKYCNIQMKIIESFK